MKKYILLTVLSVFFLSGYSQIDFVTYGSRAAVATNMANSAIELPGDLSFTFPGLSSISISATSSLSPDEFIKTQDDGRSLVDLSHLLTNLQDQNGISGHVDYAPLFVSWHTKSKKAFFTISYNQIVDFKGVFSDDLISYMSQGNASFIGQNVNINDDQFGLLHYSKLHLGYTKRINSKLNIGGKINFYGGYNHLEIAKWNANIFTDENSFPAYATSADVDLEVVSGGIIAQTIDENDSYDFGGPSELLGLGKGFGVDLGIDYKINNNFSIAASGRDLGGYIKWSEDFGRKMQIGGSGQLDFAGFETSLNSEVPGDEFERQADELEEELKTNFDFITLSESYNTNIGSSFTLSGQFLSDNKKHAVLGVIDAKQSFGDLGYRAGAVYHFSPSRWIQLSAAYSWSEAAPVNIGTGLTLDMGSAQLHFSSDNITSFFSQKDLGQVAFRFGFNIVYRLKEDPFKKDILEEMPEDKDQTPPTDTKKYFE